MKVQVNAFTYSTPTVPSKLIHENCVLCIHQWRGPVTPYPPTLYFFCNTNQNLWYEKIDYMNIYIIYLNIQFSLFFLPLDRTKPPNAKSRSNENRPNVFAIIIFLPIAPINLNNAPAAWWSNKSSKYCLKNLQERILIIVISRSGYSYQWDLSKVYTIHVSTCSIWHN